jgi:aspartate racemase
MSRATVCRATDRIEAQDAEAYSVSQVNPMSERKTVGVLGGMGPAATVEFFRRLVAATPAESDQQHLHILIDNDPSVPNRTEAILGGGRSPEATLIAMAKRLERAGANLLVMPCNTAHHYVEAIRAEVTVPVLDMVVETARRVEVRRVGLLATTGTIRAGLFRRACVARGTEVIVPGDEGQRIVMTAIGSLKAGMAPEPSTSRIVEVVGRLRDQGAQAVIAGCTELSLLDGGGMAIRWIDALDCLVEATLEASLSTA